MSYKAKYLKYKIKYLAKKAASDKSIDINDVSIRESRHSEESTMGYKWQANKRLHLEKVTPGEDSYNNVRDGKRSMNRLTGYAGDIKFNKVIFWRDNDCIQKKREMSQFRVNTASKNRIDLLNDRLLILVSLRFEDASQYNKLKDFLQMYLGEPCTERCILYSQERRRYASKGDKKTWCSV
ncbi:hypothetical protein CPAV1605_117 [seawater metagenome]|uniref:Uncharacterized protein n=1 Tax=seawater metagenome TaxID=1561972 RepID=A0A5E8CKT4_9ZZZZ